MLFRSISLAICIISSKDGVIKPETPTMSAWFLAGEFAPQKT